MISNKIPSIFHPPSELIPNDIPYNVSNLILLTDYHLFASQNIHYFILKSPIQHLPLQSIIEIFNKYLDINFILTLTTFNFTLTSLTHSHTVSIESLTVFLIYSNGLIVIQYNLTNKNEFIFLHLPFWANTLLNSSHVTFGNDVIP